MKKLKFLFFIPLLCAMQCEPEDPCGNAPPSISIINNSIISVENNTVTYQVGDTIWINSVVNKDQIDVNSKNVDLYTYDDKLNFEINLYKTSIYNQDLPIYLNQDYVVVDKGEMFYNSFIFVQEGDNYVNRTGIKLLETGNFRIRNSYINSHRLNYDCTVRAYIETKIINADNDNNYNFTVE